MLKSDKTMSFEPTKMFVMTNDVLFHDQTSNFYICDYSTQDHSHDSRQIMSSPLAQADDESYQSFRIIRSFFIEPTWRGSMDWGQRDWVWYDC